MLIFVLAIVGLAIVMSVVYLFFKLYSFTPPKEKPVDEGNVIPIGLSEKSLLDDCLSILEESRDIDSRLCNGEDVIALNIANSMKRDNLLDRFKRLRKVV